MNKEQQAIARLRLAAPDVCLNLAGIRLIGGRTCTHYLTETE
ncbi:hypothetical protein NE545_05000 [Agathobaculum butyriciproducens]|nr:hypothetical protein [Agathobaculum butyriciproducens]